MQHITSWYEDWKMGTRLRTNQSERQHTQRTGIAAVKDLLVARPEAQC